MMTRAELHENFLAAMDTIRARKGRSALTILGIVIGVASVISVAAIITGLNKVVSERVQRFGTRTIFVTRFPAAVNPFQLPEYIRTRKHLRDEDVVAIREQCRSCESATVLGLRPSLQWETNEIRRGRENYGNFLLRGAEPEFNQVMPIFSVQEGRFISRFDLEHARFVCVLGRGIADAMFPHADPLGQDVTMNGHRYEVIGVFEPDPGLFGTPGVDIHVIIPYSTFRKLYPENRERMFAVSVTDIRLLSYAQDEIAEIVRRTRRVPVDKDNDFEIAASNFFNDLWNQLTGAIVLLTSVISSIGLLVAGIGVMNIMLISVTERTQEIGVRKAVGARKQDIRAQFLIEAITLTSFGGVLGIMLGASVAFLVRGLIPSLPAELSAFWVTLGFVMSASVGLFFGFYPANHAAGLDPIVCLRYE